MSFDRLKQAALRTRRPSAAAVPFVLECPICRGPVEVEENRGLCRSNGHRFRRAGRIWRFLPLARELQFKDFLRDYKLVRSSEGWGSNNPEYYRNLPRVPRGDPQRDIWRVREISFRYLLGMIGDAARFQVLDLGAGNGWLSYQLTRRGHQVAAVDLSDDPQDGLGARVNYDQPFECYQAEFDRVPFGARQFQLVIFNAALHYSAALEPTLCESRRVLGAGGRIVVLDSPFYSDPGAGAAMIAEREAEFAMKYRINRQVTQVGFLTVERLEQAAGAAELTLEVHQMDETWSRQLRRALAQRRAGREPARFPVIVLNAS